MLRTATTAAATGTPAREQPPRSLNLRVRRRVPGTKDLPMSGMNLAAPGRYPHPRPNSLIGLSVGAGGVEWSVLLLSVCVCRAHTPIHTQSSPSRARARTRLPGSVERTRREWEAQKEREVQEKERERKEREKAAGKVDTPVVSVATLLEAARRKRAMSAIARDRRVAAVAERRAAEERLAREHILAQQRIASSLAPETLTRRRRDAWWAELCTQQAETTAPVYRASTQCACCGGKSVMSELTHVSRNY